jgi:hypothetical protein
MTGPAWTTDDLPTVSIHQVKKFKVVPGPPHGPVPTEAQVRAARRKRRRRK